jgi:hypothetical protein
MAASNGLIRAAMRACNHDYTLPCVLQLLEENYVFIKAIVDQQNLGRLPQMQE